MIYQQQKFIILRPGSRPVQEQGSRRLGTREETLAAAQTAFGGFVFPRWRNKQDPLGLHLYGTGLAGEASVLDATRCSTFPSKWD